MSSWFKAIFLFIATIKASTCPILNVPDDITQSNDAGLCSAMVTYAVSGCPGDTISQTQGGPSGSTFPLGTTVNEFVATDETGFTAIAGFNIIVEDNEYPTILNVPANIAVNNDAGLCSAIVNYATPTANDNC
eukprot:251851_1